MPMLARTSSAARSSTIGSSKRGDDLLRHRLRAVRVAGVAQQHRELVAAEARDGVGLAHQRGAGGAPTSLQHQVADVVAERVVDVLEAVEVHQQHGQRAPRARAPLDRRAQPVVEQHPVGQAGQARRGRRGAGSAPRARAIASRMQLEAPRQLAHLVAAADLHRRACSRPPRCAASPRRGASTGRVMPRAIRTLPTTEAAIEPSARTTNSVPQPAERRERLVERACSTATTRRPVGSRGAASSVSYSSPPMFRPCFTGRVGARDSVARSDSCSSRGTWRRARSIPRRRARKNDTWSAAGCCRSRASASSTRKPNTAQAIGVGASTGTTDELAARCRRAPPCPRRARRARPRRAAAPRERLPGAPLSCASATSARRATPASSRWRRCARRGWRAPTGWWQVARRRPPRGKRNRATGFRWPARAGALFCSIGG